MNLKANRKGLSPVISQIILAGTVLTVGGIVWYFSIGYCSVTTDAYINDTYELMNVAIERFTIEKVIGLNDTYLKIWVNNYGDVDITVDIYGYAVNKTASTFNIDIPAERLKEVGLDYSADPLAEGDPVQIKIYTRRQNVAYRQYTYH